MSATDEQITRDLNDLGTTLKQQPSLRAEVMREITKQTLRPRRHTRRWGALTAIAACAAFVLAVLVFRGGDRASDTFARAIDRVAKAHTFSCRQISQSVDENGKLDIHETIYMFKEPDRSRQEWVTGLDRNGEITITDYTAKRRLTLHPDKKNADIQDMSAMYEVDDQTGELLPASLDTDSRDQVMKLTAESVKDLGTMQLNGKTVRMLQSRGKKSGSIRTVYLDPQSNLPVQIVIEWPQNKQAKWTYADIQIDQGLDDSLFSVDVPKGYELFRGGPYVPAAEHFSKMMTKMRNVSMACLMYANDHNGEYPADLSLLKGPEMSEKKLQTLLAAPDQSDGPAVIVYRKPPKDPKDFGGTIVLYEAPSSRRDEKVCAAFLDGHAQVMTKEEFEKAMRDMEGGR